MGFADDQKQYQNAGFAGDLLTVPGTLQSRSPSWEQPTLFRAFPCPTAHLAEDTVAGLKQYNPEALKQPTAPWRINKMQDQFTDWIKLLPNVVRMAGTEKRLTFLSTPSDQQALGITETPYGRIDRIARAKAKNDPTWEKLRKGAPGTGAALPYMDNFIALQGLLIYHGGKDFRQEPKNVMLVLPRTATQALLEGLHAEGTNPQSNDIEQVFAGGDVVSPERGSFLRIQQKGKSEATTSGVSFGGPAGPTNRGNAGGASERGFQSYQVTFETCQALDPKMFLDSWVPWDKLIRRLTTAEQVQEICQAFKPELIAVVFRDSPFEQLVPQAIRDRYFTSGPGGFAATPPAAPAAGFAGNGTPTQFSPFGGTPAAAPPPGYVVSMTPPQTPSYNAPPPSNAPASAMPMPQSAAFPPPPSGGEKQAATGNGGIAFGNATRGDDAPPQTQYAAAPPPQNPGVQSSLDRLNAVMQLANPAQPQQPERPPA